MYTDEVECDAESVTELLYISTKYQVYPLTERCGTFLKDAMDTGNVCTILNQANMFAISELMAEALSYIGVHASSVFENADFLKLTKSSLSKILSFDNINAPECDILKSVLNWADHQCTDHGLDRNGAQKRTILGELLFKIRIPTLTLEHFSEIIAETGILHNDEELAFYRYFSKGTKNEYVAKFHDSKRIDQPFVNVELTANFKRMSPALAMEPKELFLFQSKRTLRIYQIEFFDLSQAFDTNAVKILPDNESRSVKIKITESFSVNGSETTKTILEVKRDEKGGMLNTNVLLTPNKTYHTMTVTVTRSCQTCGTQTALRLSQVQHSLVQGRKSYSCRHIHEHVSLTSKEMHIVKSIGLAVLPAESVI